MCKRHKWRHCFTSVSVGTMTKCVNVTLCQISMSRYTYKVCKRHKWRHCFTSVWVGTMTKCVNVTLCQISMSRYIYKVSKRHKWRHCVRSAWISTQTRCVDVTSDAIVLDHSKVAPRTERVKYCNGYLSELAFWWCHWCEPMHAYIHGDVRVPLCVLLLSDSTVINGNLNNP